MSEKYNWKFSTIGGATRVNISSGEDIRHLDELDQKLWTVLSCPVSNLELDAKSLKYIDVDGDGKIHVNDIVKTSKWLTSVINNADLLLEKSSELKLSSFNSENPEGAALLASAKQILANLGLEKDSISVADTEDSVAIFAKTALNGDGIITEQSTADEGLKQIIAQAVQTMGSKTDRSGLEGVDTDLVNAFYDELVKYSQWKQQADANNDSMFPYGEKTDRAYELFTSLQAKVEDFFMRCKLSAFDEDSQTVLDVSASKIETVSGKDLSACRDEIAQYPLARLNKEAVLPLDSRINPVWLSSISELKAIVFDVEYPGAKQLTESEWNSAMAKLDGYAKWLADKSGCAVETLGIERINELIGSDRKQELLDLIAADKALESESTSIDAVNKLLHLYRDFYTMLCNFVSFKDFYSPTEKAIFQAGSLYIDERCCELCIKVPDMGPHNASTSLSGMFILYCNCVEKNSGATMTIAAVLTDGDISDLREGKHGVFYDRSGNDWDATVIKIVDNPISIRQAFWSPYRKLGKFIEDTINKFAADKDAKVTGDMQSSLTTPSEVRKQQAFDIAKFTGIFAAISLAFAGLANAFKSIVSALVALPAWGWLGLIVGIILVISGPAMLKAWLMLRKRNMSPLLNANGWAINASVKVNISFGSTLTKISKTPKVVVGRDPYADKTPVWRTIAVWLVILAAVFAALLFNGKLERFGLPNPRDRKAKVENVEAAVSAVPADSPAAADSSAVADSLAVAD